MSDNNSSQPPTIDSLQARAEHPYSSKPHPFLKWVGSKRFLLSQIVNFLPKKFGAYHEPFLGAGALFFLLSPQNAYLSDTCGDLIETYRALRDNPSIVIKYLSQLTPDRASYYKIRDNPSSGRFKHAAEFIYLNKACWNGLYRVNSAGKFNVPYGSPRSKNLVDTANLHSCAETLLLSGVTLSQSDFSVVLNNAEKNDLVYLDPPYVIGHSNNGFRDYNEVLFSWEDQVRLADTANKLARLGVHVIVTNAYHSVINALYSDFKPFVIERNATLASDASKRGPVKESVFISKSIL
jgi:DNA adenine methylase